MRRSLSIIHSGILLLLLGLAVGLQTPACAQAYCYLREFSFAPMTNGVQLKLKADGILSWQWQSGSEGATCAKVEIRFSNARIGVDKTYYKVDLDPVSSAQMVVPQDSPDGRGVIFTVAMNEAAKVSANLSDDRQTFLLTIQANRTVETVRPVDFTAIKEGAYKVELYNGNMINVQAMKADIHKVVAEIARVSGLNVALDDAVQHDISLNVQNKSPLDVIRGIAAGYGLALASSNDVYMLSEGVPADLPTYQRSATASFPMRYLKAGDVKALLPSFLFKYVHDNPPQNAVVVTAPSQMMDKISHDLHAIDQPPAMMMVECAVVELTDTNDFDQNFRYLYKSKGFDINANSSTGDVNFRQAGESTTIVPTPQLQVFLQSLITKGHAQVDAHPSMAAVNGKNAEIFIGSYRYVKMTYTSYGVTQERVETVPLGVRLNMTPWTSGTGEITVYISVEMSNIVQIDPKTGVPRISRRTASTTVRCLDGETVIIGGLSQDQLDTDKRKIPLLGDIPLIGTLFTSKTKSTNKTELLILIRPRLLDSNGRLPATDDQQLRNKFLQPGDLGYIPDTTKDKPAK